MYKAFKRAIIPLWGYCRKLDTVLFRHSHPIQPRRPSVSKPLSGVYRLKSSSGSFLTDTHGNQLLDLNVGAQAPLGYNAMSLVEAQLKTAYDSSILNSIQLVSFPPQQFADFLRQHIMPVAPKGLKNLLLTPSASEAVESAIKVLLQKRGKGVILTFEGAQLGDSLATSNLAQLYKWPTVALPASILPFWENESINEEREAQALEEVIRVIESQEQAGNPVRGIVLQPINKHDMQHASGDFYKQVLRAAQQRGVAVIVDEAHCCFGAAGELWAYRNWLLHEDESPDFLIFGGRAQASGYFTKFELRRSESQDACDLRKLIQFAAIWQEITKQQILKLVGDAGTVLKVELNRASEETPWLVRKVRGEGSLLAFDCNSEEIRDSFVRYLELNGVRVGVLGVRSIVLRPALTLNAFQAGVFTHLLQRYDRQLSKEISSGLYS